VNASREHVILLKMGFILLVATCFMTRVSCQLIINVSSGEADANVYRESVTGNMSTETVTINFLTPAGLAVTQLTDFRTSVTITSITVPGQLELGEDPYQVLCFVTPGVGDMIPPEAVTKLRQKHPGAVRVAEESRGRVVIDNSASLNIYKAQYLSTHIPSQCKQARESTFVPEHLISQFKDGIIGTKKKSLRKDETLLGLSLSPEYSSLMRCAHMSADDTSPCLCVIDTCVHWYPCSLKYCRNNSGDTEHRCGIRTCARCTDMRFTARSRKYCSWDEL